MRVLGLDTSTATGGVALLDGERLVGEYTLNVQRTTHAERLMPALERVMADAGWDPAARVDGIAVAVGPGSFTGLRIGVVTAKALSYAWRVPVVGVSTLEALAYQAGGAGGTHRGRRPQDAAEPGAGQAGADVLICPMLDARHDHVYCAAYSPGADRPVLQLPPELRALDEWLPMLEEWAPRRADKPWLVFAGDGADAYWDRLVLRFGSRALRPPVGLRTLRSAAVAALGALRLAAGEADDPARLVPTYLRQSEAERKWTATNRSPS